jgi:hypothetical protein
VILEPPGIGVMDEGPVPVSASGPDNAFGARLLGPLSIALSIHQPSPDANLMNWLDSESNLACQKNTRHNAVDADRAPTDVVAWQPSTFRHLRVP